MRKDIKKMDNKGFSLVELIIVIAIMAILVGIIGSQVVPYIEKSRLSKDKSTVDTVYTAWQSAVAKEYTQSGPVAGAQLGDGNTNKTLTKAFVETDHQSEADYNLDKEIIEAIGNGVKDASSLDKKLTSKALKDCNFYFYYDKENGVIAVAAQKNGNATSSYCISSAKGAKMVDQKAADPATDMGIGVKSGGTTTK